MIWTFENRGMNGSSEIRMGYLYNFDFYDFWSSNTALAYHPNQLTKCMGLFISNSKSSQQQYKMLKCWCQFLWEPKPYLNLLIGDIISFLNWNFFYSKCLYLDFQMNCCDPRNCLGFYGWWMKNNLKPN